MTEKRKVMFADNVPKCIWAPKPMSMGFGAIADDAHAQSWRRADP